MSEPQEASGGTSPVSIALTAAAGGLAALAVSWLDPLGAGTKEKAAPEHEAVGEGYGAAEAQASVIVPMEPIIVSLSDPEQGRRRAPRLRVVIALETDEKAAKRAEEEAPRLRDGFTAVAREVGPETLTGPEGLETLRAAFLESARGVLGETSVRSVLLTDYITT